MNRLAVFLFGVTFGAWLVVTLAQFFPKNTSSYRQGQIDALNGKIVVELKQQPDGSTKWERK
jgi:hypothetical protein